VDSPARKADVREQALNSTRKYLFYDCARCGQPWYLVVGEDYNNETEDRCPECGSIESPSSTRIL